MRMCIIISQRGYIPDYQITSASGARSQKKQQMILEGEKTCDPTCNTHYRPLRTV